MVFISYCSKDRETALKIRQHLAKLGIECWLDNEAIRGGDDFAEEIVKALSPCSFYLLLLSEASQESIWVPKELVLAFNLRKPIIPLHIDRYPIKGNFSLYFSNVQLIEYAGRENDALTDLLKALRQVSGSTDISGPRQISAIRSKPAMSLSGFIGRKDELEWIDKQIKKDDGPVYLTGMGGIGKSMLAQKYARDHDDEYVCAWVSYSTNLFHTIAQMEFADEYNKGANTEEDIYERHIKYLNVYGKTLLLIIDRFEGQGNKESFDDILSVECQNGKTNYEILQKLSINNHVMVTTRADPRENCLEVGNMPANDLLNLSKQIGTRIDWTDIAERSMLSIIDQVEGHPMFVALITEAVNKDIFRDISRMEKLIKEKQFSKSQIKISARNYRSDIKDAPFDSHMKAVFQFDNYDQKQKELLRIVSFIPVDGISLEFFLNLTNEQFEETYLLETLRLFRDLHLISVNKKMLKVHVLISHYLAEELQPEYENCMQFVDQVLNYNNLKEIRKDYAMLKELASLEESVADRIVNEKNQINLYYNAGRINFKLASYELALKNIEKVLEINKRTPPFENAFTATCYFNKGIVLMRLGRYKEALEIYEKALAINKKYLPPDNSIIAKYFVEIGIVLMHLAQYKEALEILEKALAIGEKTLPPDNSIIAESFNNIGTIMIHLGQYKESQKIIEKARKIWNQSKMPNYSYIASIYDNIGIVLIYLEREKEALEVHEKALAIREKRFPPDHPAIAQSYDNIGTSMSVLGQHKKALEIHEKALFIKKKKLPPNHPDIARSYHHIGLDLHNLKQNNEGLESLKKAKEILEQTLPPGHPNIALNYVIICIVLEDLGHYQEAREYLQKALNIFKQTLPANHPYIADSYKELRDLDRRSVIHQRLRKSKEIIKLILKNL